MNDIEKDLIYMINRVIGEMLSGRKYELLAFYLHKMLNMKKVLCEEGMDLHLDVDHNQLGLPAYLLELPQEAVEWMILHEAAHLDNGDDVMLKALTEKLDYIFNEIMGELHNHMELNANLKAIKAFGGMPKRVINEMQLDGEILNIKTVEMLPFYSLIDEIHNLTYRTLNSLREKMFKIQPKQQEPPCA